LSRGPADVWGLLDDDFGLVGLPTGNCIDAEAALCECSALAADAGKGGAPALRGRGGRVLRSRLECRADLGFERLLLSEAELSNSLYLEEANWRSASFVETMKSSCSERYRRRRGVGMFCGGV
jgi:hypothetical protein